MGGIPTRTVNDMLLYTFLLGGGILFILGSSIFIPALRPASGGTSDNSALRSIQEQINRLQSSSNNPINIQWVQPKPTPTAPAPNSRNSYKVPAPAKSTGSPNCVNSNGYTIWKGNGCYNGKNVFNVAAEVKGVNNCAGARTVFLERYKCK